MRLRRKRTDLDDRLRPYLDQRREARQPMVDADPIRMFLLRWMIETGDPIEVVAKGFDLEAQVLSDILDRRMRMLPARSAEELCEQIGVDE